MKINYKVVAVYSSYKDIMGSGYSGKISEELWGFCIQVFAN